jgi:hypothetical protein
MIKAGDLGFGRDAGHDKRLTPLESSFCGILWVDHSGAKNKISAGDLAVRFAYALTGRRFTLDVEAEEIELWKRRVRTMQNHIIWFHRDIPILSKAGVGGGYWLAEDDEEAEAFYRTFRKRGLTGLVKASRGKQSVIVDAFEQLAFNFEDMVDKAASSKEVQAPRARAQSPSDNMAPELVDSLLAKMTRNPEKFAHSLRNLREKYFSGGVLLEKKRLMAMQRKAAELLADVSGLAG